jgi:hypothetical protein
MATEVDGDSVGLAVVQCGEDALAGVHGIALQRQTPRDRARDSAEIIVPSNRARVTGLSPANRSNNAGRTLRR